MQLNQKLYMYIKAEFMFVMLFCISAQICYVFIEQILKLTLIQ